ncbi:YlxR family protein [Kineosporia babensis]|uniref:YlxR family protein n=1 Tax=Kineosporia babensis TaxID=499548 RepID=A0A9X1SVN7_9ACTN|nr:YlxR family protein [Kineosporia babensis]MCD5313854.1 YlxR family protein [Kineosporia babensis]
MISGAGHAATNPEPSSSSRNGPIRTCVGCRERALRSDLLRVVAAELGGKWCAVPDPGHKLSGRGASLHPQLSCLELAERRRAFPRALRRGGPLDAVQVREFVTAQASEVSLTRMGQTL